MANDSIDDEWADLLSNDPPGPTPVVAVARPEVPTPPARRADPSGAIASKALAVSDRPTVPELPVIPVVPKDAAERYADAEPKRGRPAVRAGRKTASVLAVPATSDTIPFRSRTVIPKPKTRAAVAPSILDGEAPLRQETRRLVVHPPPGDDSVKVDETPQALPAVPVDPEIDAELDPEIDPMIDSADSDALQDPRALPGRTVAVASVDIPEPVSERPSARSSSSRAYVPQMAEPMIAGGGPSLLPWLLGSAAIVVVGAMAWGAFTPSEETPTVADASIEPKGETPVVAETTRKSSATPRDVEDPSEGANAGGPPSKPDKPAVKSQVKAPVPDRAVQQTKQAAAVMTADVAPLDPEASSRYAAAATRYSNDSSQEALEIMAKAACALDDGVNARSAFRKLKGGDVRSSVMIACRKTSVDLTAKGDEPTPAALVRKAERAMAAGDLETAAELARKSNRLERSQAALLVGALTACAGGDLDKTISMRRHLGNASRKTLAKRCPSLELPD
ncbi:MAG: hypothetical protein JKY37_26870 [Nannocystaceae bacterium]|nr:hypothetical protein [Nannocystaceae bacterium]